MKVFLGGTVNGSQWREKIIPQLKVDYFNPVVEDWDEKAYHRELYERENCEFCLYVITPLMTGFYAIAEVIDDSYKKTDKTLFCYLKEDEKFTFSEKQISSLEKTGKIIIENGGVWLKSLDEVVNFLNKASDLGDNLMELPGTYHDVFISYGRRHSLAFARKMHDRFAALDMDVWFDQNDIPLGVDFQEQIDAGIKHADNFVFIISPHSVKSLYCLKEIVLALKYNKRIIPVLHIEPSDCFDKIHPVIAKINWVYAREKENFDVPLEEWEMIDDFNNAFEGLINLINKHQNYVRQHTVILDKALTWEQKGKITNRLLVGKDRQVAEKWLLTDFGKEQPPCFPTNLHCEYICEAKKNAHNMMTDVFLSFAAEDTEVCNELVQELSRYAITTWLHHKDIEKGSDFITSIESGIIKADNIIYIISKHSHTSDYCSRELSLALKNNKRIIPVIIEETDTSHLPEEIKVLQYIDFTNRSKKELFAVESQEDVEKDVSSRKDKSPFQKAIDELLRQLRKDHDYYEQHKILLTQAYKWLNQNQNYSILLRGHNLEKAVTWLKMGEGMPHPPTEIHQKFIAESRAKAGMFKSEVFISYSRTDADFARRLNEDLQLTGKTTWFDQESIAAGADFQREIYKGIESSDNFLFIISPESVKSPYCADEVSYAASFNKRFVSVLSRETEVALIPLELAQVQWIDFQNRDYRDAFGEVVRTVDTDREYVSKHTRYMQLAAEWNEAEQNGKNGKDHLLRTSEYISAKTWLFEAFGIETEDFEGSLESFTEKKAVKQPAPTLLQISFIENSRLELNRAMLAEKEQQEKMLLLEKEKAAVAQRSARRQRIFLIAVSLALVVAIILGVYSVIQGKKALESEKEAKAQTEKALEQERLAKIAKENALNEKAKADSLKISAENAADSATVASKRAEKAKKMAQIQTAIARNLNTISEDLINDLLESEMQGVSEESIKTDKDKYLYFKQTGIDALANGQLDDALANFKIAQFWTKSKNIDTSNEIYYFTDRWGYHLIDNYSEQKNKAISIKINDLIARTNQLAYELSSADKAFSTGNFDKAKSLYRTLDEYPEKIQAVNIKMGEIKRIEKVFEDIFALYDNFTYPETINLSGKKLTTVPDYIWDNPNLTQLNLSNNELSYIPPEIYQLDSLKDLNLSHNKFKTLPDEIFKLSELKTLNISNNQIEYLYPDLSGLEKLEWLDVSNNNLQYIDNVFDLNELKYLNAGNNPVSGLNYNIKNLQNLKELNFSGCYISQLPATFVNLPMLENLDLSDCSIGELPDNIGKLTNLTNIQLNNNYLTELPASVSGWKKVTTLNLTNNKLKTLPAEIGEMEQLQSLILSENEIEYIPAEISQLTNITVLNLNFNKITGLPDEFSQMNVSTVYLMNNNLEKIPSCVFGMKKLQMLNVSNNLITEIPADIQQSTSLRTISLFNNKVSSISDEIKNNSTLNVLILGKNPVSEEQIEQLQQWLPNLTIAR